MQRTIRAGSGLATSLALLALALDCGGAAPSPAADAGAGERLVRTVFVDGLSRGDSAALEQAVAPAFTLHAHGQAVTLSPERLWAATGPIRAAFPDVRFTVEEVVAEGDRLAARVAFTGTHRGAWEGIAPTGRRVRVTEMFMCRVADGRLAECWQEWDEAGLRQQLGGEPPRPNGA